MVEMDNPAGRLHAVFSVLQSRSADNSDDQTGTILSELFGLTYPKDAPWILERLAPIVRLPAQIRREVGQLPFDGTAFLGRVHEFEDALGRIYLPQVARDLVSGITDAGMESLEACSNMLHQHRAERLPSAEETAEMRASIVELLDGLADSGAVDEQVETFLSGHLVDMLRALDELRLVGPKALEAALQRALGHTFIVTATGHALPDLPEVRTFWKVLNRIAVVLAIVAEGSSITRSLFPEQDAEQPQAPAVIQIDEDQAAEADPD